eukprot:TRINITY_DN5734_c0_g1_i2.p1 TRINITY_DN5734_c0_g1~~TRINITY_DN5734_c0_g1_i2.p1  ORF type:complete len:106 (-),score=16.02 TRINITY_DN5734_c0_g1_i2:326-643(-)
MAEPSGPGLLAPPKSLPGGIPPPTKKEIRGEDTRKPKGAIPEFGKFGESNVGFTGVFAVKKQQRRQGDDDLFPEPQPMGYEAPKVDTSTTKTDEGPQGGCCCRIL